MWRKRGDRDGSELRRAEAIVIDVKANGGGSSYAGLPYYDLKLRARFEDGSNHEFKCRVGSPYAGTQLHSGVGDIVPVRYDPRDRSTVALDEQAMDEERNSRSDAFHAAAIHGAEMALDAKADDATRTDAPTDADLQHLSNRWNAAMAQARACMDAHNDAKAAGDTTEAQRQLAAGALANAEQVQLGEQYTRLRRQRPDWEPTGD